MATAIGHDAVTACASYRAGITRPKSYTPSFDLGLELAGYPVDGVTDGYQGVGRLMRLATMSIQDLIEYEQRPPLHIARQLMSCHLAFHLYRKGSEREVPSVSIADQFYQRLTARFGSMLPTTATYHERGHVSGLLALNGAIEDLESERCTHALVIGVASCFDEDMLAPLIESRRVKTEDNPQGPILGEAAVCILLERQRDGERRAGACARLASPVVMHEPASSAAGGVLGTVINEAHALLARQQGWVSVLVSDLNGEPSRSHDFGCSVPRLHADLRDTRVKIWVPAESFGDTNAASALIGVCAVSRGFARSYVHGDAIVSSASDDGARGAIAVMRP